MTSFNQFYVQLLWYFHVYLLFVTLSTAQNGPNFRYDYSDDYAIARACRFKHNDTAGMCRQISDCPQVYVDWEQLNIVPTTCWYDRDVPVVCCLEVTEPQRPKQRISEKKCLDVYAPKPVPGFFHGGGAVGGKRTQPGEFPHMAAIGWIDVSSKEIDWKCGGTLISEAYVMTAAHCLTSISGRPDIVRLNETDLRGKGLLRMPSDIVILDYIKHPDYRVRKYYNDIALLRLSKRIPISAWIRPACLWQMNAINATKLTALGYGLTEYGGKPSVGLMKVSLKLYAESVCSLRYRSDSSLDNGILRSQVCAGDETGAQDTCQGDSGGPLLTVLAPFGYHTFYVTGITSFGQGCATKQPGVYTRVSEYLDWIESVVWP